MHALKNKLKKARGKLPLKLYTIIEKQKLKIKNGFFFYSFYYILFVANLIRPKSK